eukprot:3556682-Amphidinium_carterae.1
MHRVARSHYELSNAKLSGVDDSVMIIGMVVPTQALKDGGAAPHGYAKSMRIKRILCAKCR